MKNPFLIKNQRIKIAIFLILTLAWTVFIISLSLNNAEESNKQSDTVVVMVKRVAQALGIDIADGSLLPHYVRKSAHFIEFGILGMLCLPMFRALTQRTFAHVLISLGYCGLIAVTDEYIQLFTYGRSGQLSDVLIDFSGCFRRCCDMCGELSFSKNKEKRGY